MDEDLEAKVAVLQDWRVRTNGSLDRLAAASDRQTAKLEEISGCIATAEAYRKGRIDAIKILIGVAGLGTVTTITKAAIDIFA